MDSEGICATGKRRMCTGSADANLKTAEVPEAQMRNLKTAKVPEAQMRNLKTAEVPEAQMRNLK